MDNQRVSILRTPKFIIPALASILLVSGIFWYINNKQTPETTIEPQVEIKMTATSSGSDNTQLAFDVIEKSTGKNVPFLRNSHGEPMHVVGVRKGDLGEFFHIHPQLVGEQYIVDHEFTEPGIYSIWPGIEYKGAHYNPQMPDLTIGSPSPITNNQPNLSRVLKLNDNLVVTLKAAGKLYAGVSHNIGFAITDQAGTAIPLGKYLEENVHINIISSDTANYSHLHTNYGMIGQGELGSTLVESKSTKILGLKVISEASAQTSHMHHVPNGTAETDPIPFDENDLRVLHAFPQAGQYRIFAEFITAANPDEVQTASFWVDVGEGVAQSGQSSDSYSSVLIVVALVAVSVAASFGLGYLKNNKNTA